MTDRGRIWVSAGYQTPRTLQIFKKIILWAGSGPADTRTWDQLHRSREAPTIAIRNVADDCNRKFYCFWQVAGKTCVDSHLEMLGIPLTQNRLLRRTPF